MPTVTIPSTLQLTHEQFRELARANRDRRLEQTATGELIVMPPTGSITGKRNSDLNGQLWLWNRQTKLGQTFDSSAGFHLPNGATRSPDAAWVSQARWDGLTPEEHEGFAPLCPDFVLELRSPSDNLKPLQEKMREYIANGAQLGWLIDRKNTTVEIYQPPQVVTILQKPPSLLGDPVLPGFVLALTEIW